MIEDLLISLRGLALYPCYEHEGVCEFSTGFCLTCGCHHPAGDVCDPDQSEEDYKTLYEPVLPEALALPSPQERELLIERMRAGLRQAREEAQILKDKGERREPHTAPYLGPIYYILPRLIQLDQLAREQGL